MRLDISFHGSGHHVSYRSSLQYSLTYVGRTDFNLGHRQLVLHDKLRQRLGFRQELVQQIQVGRRLTASSNNDYLSHLTNPGRLTPL
jgi:hypothetical protein